MDMQLKMILTVIVLTFFSSADLVEFIKKWRRKYVNCNVDALAEGIM